MADEKAKVKARIEWKVEKYQRDQAGKLVLVGVDQFSEEASDEEAAVFASMLERPAERPAEREGGSDGSAERR